jgi:hypothetical protein
MLNSILGKIEVASGCRRSIYPNLQQIIPPKFVEMGIS